MTFIFIAHRQVHLLTIFQIKNDLVVSYVPGLERSWVKKASEKVAMMFPPSKEIGIVEIVNVFCIFSRMA